MKSHSKNALFIAILLLCQLTACHYPNPVTEATEARRKSDSLMEEFKKVNAELEKLNSRILEKNDSALKYMDSLVDSLKN